MKLYMYFKSVFNNIRQEHIGAFAAQASFFFVLSFFPMILLCLTILGFSKTGTEFFLNFAADIAPFIKKSQIASVINGYSFKRTSVISFSTILTAWSAGKGFYALSDGFSTILNINESRSYLVLRIRGLFYSVAFAAVIALLYIIGVLGGNIRQVIFETYPGYFITFSILRILFILTVIFIILALLYIFLPDRRAYMERKRKSLKLKYHLFSAAASSVCICVYTALFSFYLNYFSFKSHIYGGISAFISAMLWIYGSMYILILGFRLSVYLNTKRNCI